MSNADTPVPGVSAELLKLLDHLQVALQHIASGLDAGFWTRGEFWIGLLLGLGGIVVSAFGLRYSIKAFREASIAATAARAAARSVKIQSVTPELHEVAQKLGAIDFAIDFITARVVLLEATSRLTRYTMPFKDDPRFSETIAALRNAARDAWTVLDGVRPSDPAKPVPNAVFNGIDGSFSQLVQLISELLGLMETETPALGDDDVDDAH
jgi:hypothetical protein